MESFAQRLPLITSRIPRHVRGAALLGKLSERVPCRAASRTLLTIVIVLLALDEGAVKLACPAAEVPAVGGLQGIAITSCVGRVGVLSCMR